MMPRETFTARSLARNKLMAIKPSSDIVLDVLKAADPVRAQAAAQRLSALGAANLDAPDEFTKVLEAAQQAPVADSDIVTDAANMRDRLQNLDAGAMNDLKAARTQVEFEASILKSFV